MNTPQKRWGWSALSKENRATAYPEEVMVDKKTGEFLIKTQQGDFMSYNVVSRTKAHIDSVTATAQSRNLYGNMYLLELTNSFPMVLTDGGLNLAEPNENIDIPGQISKLLISLDIDSLVVENGGLTRERFDPKVTLEFHVLDKQTGLVAKTFLSSDNLLTSFNEKVFTISVDDITAMGGIHISKLDIILDDADPTKTYRHILNSIIVVIE